MSIIYSLLLKCLPRSLKLILKEKWGVPEMELCLKRLSRDGFRPLNVIDVGAFKGEWTEICKRVFPDSNVLMIEPQSSKTEFLRAVCKRYPGCNLVNVLLGSEKKRVKFRLGESGSEVLQKEPAMKGQEVELCCELLDDIVKGGPFLKPQLMKLDVQGYELEVLKGAKNVLDNVEVIVMEVNAIPLIFGAPSVQDVIQFMADNNFRLFDICTLGRRPVDAALWYFDAFFVRNDSSYGSASKGWG